MKVTQNVGMNVEESILRTLNFHAKKRIAHNRERYQCLDCGYQFDVITRHLGCPECKSNNVVIAD